MGKILRMKRETHSFDQRMMHMMRVWYPDRSERLIRDTVNSFYNYEQSFPDEQGNVLPHIENRLVKMLIMYRSM